MSIRSKQGELTRHDHIIKTTTLLPIGMIWMNSSLITQLIQLTEQTHFTDKVKS